MAEDREIRLENAYKEAHRGVEALKALLATAKMNREDALKDRDRGPALFEAAINNEQEVEKIVNAARMILVVVGDVGSITASSVDLQTMRGLLINKVAQMNAKLVTELTSATIRWGK